MTKLLVEKARKYYKEQVNAKKCEVKYEVDQESVVEDEQLHYDQRPHSKNHYKKPVFL
jgi:hypothetical protein